MRRFLPRNLLQEGLKKAKTKEEKQAIIDNAKSWSPDAAKRRVAQSGIDASFTFGLHCLRHELLQD
jgi:hypothetical protein